MRPTTSIVPLLILLTAPLSAPLAAPLEAQVEIERRRPAPATGEVSIESAFGSIVVRAWERNEVEVRGTLAAGAEGLDFDGDKEGVSIDVSVPDAWFHAPGEDAAFRTALEIDVPVGASISVDSVNASVDVAGVAGEVHVSTVNGAVKVAGPTKGVEVETMTGAIEVRASAAPMRIHTISGKVDLAGVAGEVDVESVSGPVEVAGGGVSQLEIESTTGSVLFRGTLAQAGSVRIETFSSPVRLVLPRTAKAELDLTSFSGEIKSDFCAGTPVTRERFEPFRQLRCSTGPEGFEIEVRTHDADITVAAEGGEEGARP
jgi:hypothetical protein